MIPQQGTLEISRSRLKHNLTLLRQQLPAKTRLCATIKADAYGHGVSLLADLLHAEGIEWACVYSLDEALDLARLPFFGILALAPIILTKRGSLDPELLDALRGQIRINLTDAASAEHLSNLLVRRGIEQPVNVHVQVDTGLTRAGADRHSIIELAEAIAALPALQLEGIFAHLSHGDVPEHDTLAAQFSVLRDTASDLQKYHPNLMVHLQNSGGSFHVKGCELDMARIGIAMYGLQPSTDHVVKGLQPIARLVAPILAIHDRPAGVGVGYGHTFITQRKTRLAILPVGYADGYPRSLSNRGIVQIRGIDAPVVGRVSMDQIIVDITDIPSASLGDTAEVISWNPDQPNSVDRLADTTGTIGYEITTHFGARLRRVIVE